MIPRRHKRIRGARILHFSKSLTLYGNLGKLYATSRKLPQASAKFPEGFGSFCATFLEEASGNLDERKVNEGYSKTQKFAQRGVMFPMVSVNLPGHF